jgi:hypothetical protein
MINIKGKRFGRWLVIRKASTKGTGDSVKLYWLCQCDCGIAREVSSWSLRSGDSNSCGCLQSIEASTRMTRIHQNGGRRKPHAGLKRIWVVYRTNARKRKLEWALTREQFSSLVRGNCVFCGALPSRLIKHRQKLGDEKFNGIDREDSERGYSPDNCNSCCTRCNLMKLDLSREKFLGHLQRILDKHPQG